MCIKLKEPLPTFHSHNSVSHTHHIGCCFIKYTPNKIDFFFPVIVRDLSTTKLKSTNELLIFMLTLWVVIPIKVLNT